MCQRFWCLWGLDHDHSICAIKYFMFLGTFQSIANFNHTKYESSVRPCTPIRTVVLEASITINSSDVIEHVEFGIIEGSVDSGDFLINGMVPPVIQQPPFQFSYALSIVTGRRVNTENKTNITFNLYSMINTSSGVLMPQATVILQLPGAVN